MAGTVPYDERLLDAERAASALLDFDPHAPAVTAIDELARELRSGQRLRQPSDISHISVLPGRSCDGLAVLAAGERLDGRKRRFLVLASPAVPRRACTPLDLAARLLNLLLARVWPCVRHVSYSILTAPVKKRVARTSSPQAAGVTFEQAAAIAISGLPALQG